MVITHMRLEKLPQVDLNLSAPRFVGLLKKAPSLRNIRVRQIG